MPKYRVLIEAVGQAAEKLGFSNLWVEIENPTLYEALKEASRILGINLIEAVQNLATAEGGIAVMLNGRRIDDLNEKIEDLSKVIIVPIYMGG